MPDNDEVTQIGPDGVRVPVEQAQDVASYDGPVDSAEIDPETQIAPDGSRRSMEELDVGEDGDDAEGGGDEGAGVTQIDEEGTRRSIEETDPEAAAQLEEESSEDDDDAGQPRTAADAEEDEAEEPTLSELKARARELDISGRSSMNRDELADAVAEAEADQR